LDLVFELCRVRERLTAVRLVAWILGERTRAHDRGTVLALPAFAVASRAALGEEVCPLAVFVFGHGEVRIARSERRRVAPRGEAGAGAGEEGCHHREPAFRSAIFSTVAVLHQVSLLVEMVLRFKPVR
jgi:hypothetical protein